LPQSFQAGQNLVATGNAGQHAERVGVGLIRVGLDQLQQVFIRLCGLPAVLGCNDSRLHLLCGKVWPVGVQRCSNGRAVAQFALLLVLIERVPSLLEGFAVFGILQRQRSKCLRRWVGHGRADVGLIRLGAVKRNLLLLHLHVILANGRARLQASHHVAKEVFLWHQAHVVNWSHDDP
jgi:hypothetical protein